MIYTDNVHRYNTDYFGLCPRCYLPPTHDVEVGACQFFACRECRTFWLESAGCYLVHDGTTFVEEGAERNKTMAELEAEYKQAFAGYAKVDPAMPEDVPADHPNHHVARFLDSQRGVMDETTDETFVQWCRDHERRRPPGQWPY